MKFTAIPYRRWRAPRLKGDPPVLVESATYARVMKRIGEAISAGHAVTMDHRIVNASPKINAPYDVIDVEIEDHP